MEHFHWTEAENIRGGGGGYEIEDRIIVHLLLFFPFSPPERCVLPHTLCTGTNRHPQDALVYHSSVFPAFSELTFLFVDENETRLVHKTNEMSDDGMRSDSRIGSPS